MEDNEARVIDEAIKFIQSALWTGGVLDTKPVPYPTELALAVKDYLHANGETLESY